LLAEFIGGSPAIQKLRTLLPRLASDQQPIVLIGEAGTGKTLFASHIHALSPFREKSIEWINFSITSDRTQRITLLGAEPPENTTSRRGLLEMPTTVILKHLDQAPDYIQSMLAEVLRQGRVTRLGSSESIPLQCRLVMTVRRPLAYYRKRGAFHSALLGQFAEYRHIRIQDLNERKEDVALLAIYYAKRFAGNVNSVPEIHVRGFNSRFEIEDSLAMFLQGHPWPDNIRDLITFIRSLVILPYDFQSQRREELEVLKRLTMLGSLEEFSLRETLSSLEDSFIARALQLHSGHQAKAAQHLGLSDRGVRRKVK
jgi:DNA-binding NtrC family response regulator